MSISGELGSGRVCVLSVIASSYWERFVCLGFFVPLEYFSLLWRRHRCRWRAANYDMCPALMAIEQWEFFDVPHLLWHAENVTQTQMWAIPQKLIMDDSKYTSCCLCHRDVRKNVRKVRNIKNNYLLIWTKGTRVDSSWIIYSDILCNFCQTRRKN